MKIAFGLLQDALVRGQLRRGFCESERVFCNACSFAPVRLMPGCAIAGEPQDALQHGGLRRCRFPRLRQCPGLAFKTPENPFQAQMRTLYNDSTIPQSPL